MSFVSRPLAVDLVITVRDKRSGGMMSFPRVVGLPSSVFLGGGIPKSSPKETLDARPRPSAEDKLNTPPLPCKIRRAGTFIPAHQPIASRDAPLTREFFASEKHRCSSLGGCRESNPAPAAPSEAGCAGTTNNWLHADMANYFTKWELQLPQPAMRSDCSNSRNHRHAGRFPNNTRGFPDTGYRPVPRSNRSS